MILNSISIVNYKNIEEAHLTLSPNLNCFIGNNGEGKTNFIDAIYYLSFCRSAFNYIDSQVLRHEQDYFMLEGNYTDYEGNKENITCGMQHGKKKHFKRNKKEYRRLSEHLGLIPIILVSPSDISLIEGSNDERRHLMDSVIAQYDKEYIHALSRYNNAMQQRNVLLKKESANHSLQLSNSMVNVLEVFEEEMAAQGEIIFNKRNEFITSIASSFQKYYSLISADKEKVSLKYISHCQRGRLLNVIQLDRQKDLAVGYSLHGIHRDDLEMNIDGYPMRKEGSQGQNKSFVLALKLAVFEYLKERQNGRVPILLLDDIFDKLDSQRVEQIIKIVSSDDFGQIFITDTNRQHLDEILKRSRYEYKIYYVEKGCLEEKNSI
ncbi:MAG: DNA replication and repair protein RecF [Prevotellaceae bacterium]|nr:DNA replication and repair protein RecF [Prevotellaceae bacterium]